MLNSWLQKDNQLHPFFSFFFLFFWGEGGGGVVWGESNTQGDLNPQAHSPVTTHTYMGVIDFPNDFPKQGSPQAEQLGKSLFIKK